jgi:hypothetical protein
MADWSRSRSRPGSVSPVDSPTTMSFRHAEGSLDHEIVDSDDEKQKRKEAYKEPRAHRASKTVTSSKNGSETAKMSAAMRAKQEIELEHLERAESNGHGRGKGKGTGRTKKKPRRNMWALLRKHCARFWICYLIGAIIFLAIFLPLL